MGTLNFSFSPTASAKTMKNIIRSNQFEICVSPRAMPLSDLVSDLEGNKPGIQIDFAKALADKMKIDLKVTWLSYNYHAKYTNCDAFMGIPHVKGEAENAYVKKTIPYFKFKILFVHKKKLDLRNKNDFKGLNIGVDAGAQAHDALQESGANFFISYTTEVEKLDALNRGDIDIALVTNLGLDWYKSNHPDFNAEVTSTSIVVPKHEYDYVIGLRQADMMTVHDFNLMISNMINNGQLAAIFKKYGVNYIVNKVED